MRPKSAQKLSGTRTVDLAGQCRERQFPLRKRLRAGALIEIGEGQSVQHIDAAGGELERMIVITDRRVRVAALSIVVSKHKVAGRRGGALLEKRGKIILGSALFRYAEILAVARAVVEPDVA